MTTAAKSPAPFVQIAQGQGGLHALDADGNVWAYVWNKRDKVDEPERQVWVKLNMERR